MDHVVSPDGEFALSRQGEAQIGLVKLMISFICSVLGWIVLLRLVLYLIYGL
jgi:hypothetical protein